MTMTQIQTNNFEPTLSPKLNKKEKKRPEPIKVLHDFSETVEEVAVKLIPKFHSELGGANFIYKCRSVATKRGGNPISGTVKRATPNERLLSRGRFSNGGEADFILEVAIDLWNPMSASHRTALVDHLLTRCVGVEDDKTGEMRYGIRSPHAQEFPEVAERHGKWNDALSELAECLKDK
jgi:hypothetical protein